MAKNEAPKKEVKNKPDKIRFGNVVLNVWSNTNAEGKSYKTFTFEKIYKNDDGEWASTQSFSLQELASVKVVIDYLSLQLVKESEE